MGKGPSVPAKKHIPVRGLPFEADEQVPASHLLEKSDGFGAKGSADFSGVYSKALILARSCSVISDPPRWPYALGKVLPSSDFAYRGTWVAGAEAFILPPRCRTVQSAPHNRRTSSHSSEPKPTLCASDKGGDSDSSIRNSTLRPGGGSRSSVALKMATRSICGFCFAQERMFPIISDVHAFMMELWRDLWCRSKEFVIIGLTHQNSPAVVGLRVVVYPSARRSAGCLG